jgi:RNA polymerase sigma-70 factor, ECF subfamily
MRITAAQRPLYTYIRSLVVSPDDVEDILQEVNLVLWRKIGEFDGSVPFTAWAFRIAYLQVLAYSKRRRREQHAQLDEALLSEIAESMAGKIDHLDARVEALRGCLAKLHPQLRGMILRRYDVGGSVQAIADELHRPTASVRVSLHRIRQSLIACIGRTLTAQGHLWNPKTGRASSMNS